MIVPIVLRRGTAAAWTTANSVLRQGELGVETDTFKAKLGDGATAWNSLAYWNPGGTAGGVSSVFGRTGAVIAQSGDYTYAQVGATPLQPWQFLVPAPSGGDDTSAILTVIRNAVTYAQAHNFYAEVIFQAGEYLLNSAPSSGTSATCNAILPIDPIATAGQKVSLVLKGTRRQTALYHWQQTAVQTGGTTLKTAYSGGTVPTAGNEPSMIGGSTPHNGYGEAAGVFSNMHLIIDGIGLIAPQNPEVAGFDFRGIGEVTVISASALAATTGTGAPARPDANSGLWAWGLYMPQSNNNDICDIGAWSCEGFPVGLWLEEHAAVTSARLINCYTGLFISPSSGFPHGNWVGYASIENCHNAIAFGSGATAKLVADLIDVEWDAATGGPIVDIVGGTNALGQVNVCANGSSGASLSAAMSSGLNANSSPIGGLRVINTDMTAGPVSSPSAPPASGAAWANPYWRDAWVTLHATTITGVSIDSTAQNGLATSPASYTFLLPSGHSYTPTYTGTLTHTVTLL